MLPKARQDREQQKFREPSLNKVSVAVSVEQESGSSIPVFIEENGSDFYQFNEVNSVASAASATVLTYTIPTGQSLTINGVNVSGENIAVYTLLIDSVVFDKVRTYFTNYNTSFNIDNITATAGQTIEIEVENFRPTTSDFNANLYGKLT
jgi:hypothetical protein